MQVVRDVKRKSGIIVGTNLVSNSVYDSSNTVFHCPETRFNERNTTAIFTKT
jgi:hypothetical protein